MRARIDSETETKAAEAFRATESSVSDAIRLLMIRVANEKRLPFAVQAPNAATLEAMKELDEGKGRCFSNAEDFFRGLGIQCAGSGPVRAIQA